MAVIGLFAFETAYETKIEEVKRVGALWETSEKKSVKFSKTSDFFNDALIKTPVKKI